MQKFPYLASLFLSAIALVLLVVNLSITVGNRSKQNDLVQRQNTVSQGQPIVQLDQAVVRLIAEASIKNSDSQLHALLTQEGIPLPGDPVPPPATAADKK
jgi:hypothetical protein